MKLRLFYRSLLRQKMAWTLNVLGLSVAFAVLFIVIKQVKYDFSFDTCYPKSENVYQLGFYNVASGKQSSYLSTPIIRQALEPIPEITAYTILWCDEGERTNFYCGDTEYQNVPYYGVYPGFMQVFQPRIIAGDAEDALKNKSGLVIPQSLARKWFGEENPVGRNIGFGKKNNLWLIKAVYEDFPENSSIRNAVILKMNEDNDWEEWSYIGFFRTQEGVNKDVLEKKIIRTVDSLYLAQSNGEKSFSGNHIFKVRTMEELYFSPDAQDVFNKHGNWSLTLCLLAIGVLIILIAYINFINFSTALAPSRIGALNICKISGASDFLLRAHILGEAIVLSLVAWALAFFWIEGFCKTALSKAYFSASLSPADNLGLYLLLGAGALVGGLLAGLYPSYYMTSFRPALVLKGSFALSGSGRRLRDMLLLFQFVVTILLIIASLFVVIQHHYLLGLPWGYQKENIVYAPTNRTIEQAAETFRSELMQNPGVLDVTSSRFIPGHIPMSWGQPMDTIYLQFYAWPVAHNFLSFFGIPVYEGDTLRQPPAGKDYAILNRKMVEKFGLQDMIGKDGIGCFDNSAIVLGFAEDVHFASLHRDIEPMAFICGDDMWNVYIFVKIRPENVSGTIQYLKDCFAKYGNRDVDIQFLDNYMNRLYLQEENLSRIIMLLCSITVLISLAGIYGLILFNIRYKVKEVGIRKINGASNSQVLWMLHRLFIGLVAGGFVIATPLAYFVVNGWLNNYPYHTPVYWWVFVVALLITLVITLVTVSWQSWKAANANPVDAVKTE